MTMFAVCTFSLHLIACPQKTEVAPATDASPTATAPTAETATASAAPPAASVDKAKCAALKDKHVILREKDNLACKTDEDCLCFGLCGFNGWGAASAATAKELLAVENEAKAAGCVDGIRCGGWSCIPSCVKNKCTHSKHPF